LLRNVK